MILLLAVIFVFGIGQLIAKASFVSLYAQTCSGDWQHPENAAGNPLATEESESAFFTVENSASLMPGNQGALVCEQFQVNDTQGKILRVKLHLAWAFKDTPIEEVAPAPTSIPDPIPVLTEVPAPIEEQPIVEEQLIVEPPAVIEEPVPAPTPSDLPVQIETESEPQAFLRRFVPVAAAAGPEVTAQLVFNGIKDFITIEYSFDGSAWQSIDNADLEIPVSSWQDVQDIKVRVRTLDPDTDVSQAVYVEGMWLEAKYVEGDGEEEAATDEIAPETFTDMAVDFLSDIPSALQDLIGESTPSVAIDSVLGDDSSADAETSRSARPTPDAPAHPDFTFMFQETMPLTVPKTSSSVVVRGELLGQGIAIEGTCSKEYFVVLVFADTDDYRMDPSRAIFNRASLCRDGRYSYSLKSDDLPGSLGDGQYYLMTGEQDEETPWIVHPFMHLFKLGRR